MENVKVQNKVEAKENAGEGMAQVGMGLTLASAGLIALWGTACFVSALAQNGVLGMVKGWLMAVGG